ncbi:hypothetical protein [Neorhizobium sp. JUb45]|uniref:hypothetical protein n=1 Tax=Neorhizobium sp. JUb45 TaxID=2485113 RepID=UPI0010EBA566|nr:hypothetical protein [Neorhizobium sp. JUb45]TCR01082.1 hypothetical protein EDF70_10587 [Neorhizobium sp. JUb45]
MTDRTFPEESISVEGNPLKAMKISCAHCGAVAYHPFQTGHKRRPPVAAQQYFQNKGWSVGSSARKDFCPLHARPAQRKATKNMTNAVANPAPMAEPPRECTREDRRIIMEKLDEVYGKDAYKTPWTDTAVAKDLGVPRDWVTKTRDEFFGPAGSNPLFDEYAEKQVQVTAAMEEVSDLVKKADAAASASREAFNALVPKVDELRSLARRIEREIGR